MPRISETFPSKTLAAADLPDEGQVFTIRRVTTVEYDDGTKLQIVLDESEKDFIANLTNSRTIAALHGDDTDDWTGDQITIYPTETQYGSKMVPAIRVRTKVPRPKSPARPAPAPTAARRPGKTTPAMTQAEADAALGDGARDEEDIPF